MEQDTWVPTAIVERFDRCMWRLHRARQDAHEAALEYLASLDWGRQRALLCNFAPEIVALEKALGQIEYPKERQADFFVPMARLVSWRGLTSESPADAPTSCEPRSTSSLDAPKPDGAPQLLATMTRESVRREFCHEFLLYIYELVRSAIGVWGDDVWAPRVRRAHDALCSKIADRDLTLLRQIAKEESSPGHGLSVTMHRTRHGFVYRVHVRCGGKRTSETVTSCGEAIDCLMSHVHGGTRSTQPTSAACG